MKILIVDDELNLCQLYKAELEDEGYEIAVAHNCDQAISKVQSESPDLVTLDIRMSYPDEGICTLRLIKQQQPKLPIIMVSAYDYTDEIPVWAADAYVVKSSDLTEFKTAIRKLLPCDSV